MSNETDEPTLHFDHAVRDIQNGVRVDVTLCHANDEDVQINITPISASGVSGPRLVFFLGRDAALGLGHALLAAGRGEP